MSERRGGVKSQENNLEFELDLERAKKLIRQYLNINLNNNLKYLKINLCKYLWHKEV